MDLFEYMSMQRKKEESPLAVRMRPKNLDEVVGQQHIIGKDKLLYRAIKADKISSLIFYGPPGTGKTTLAKVIANTTSANFVQMNATTSGKKDMEINPEMAAAKEISHLLRFPGASKIDTFADGRVRLIKFALTAEQGLDGVAIREIPTRLKSDILVCRATGLQPSR